MPLYEYRCSACGATFEQLRRMNEADAAQACPKCESPKVERQFSTFAPQMGASSSAPTAPCGGPASGCASGRCPYSS